MRIQFCHSNGQDIIAEFEVYETPTKEQCEAIEDEIYKKMDEWEATYGDLEEFPYWSCCYEAARKHIYIKPNPVVKTIYI
jgi:hypothetical protein